MSDEDKIKRIRAALIDMAHGKLSEFTCLQIIAIEVFYQEEIAAYAKDDSTVTA